MSNADAARSDQAWLAARARWWEREGNTVLSRAAETVIQRAEELPPTVRAQVHLATADLEAPGGNGDGAG